MLPFSTVVLSRAAAARQVVRRSCWFGQFYYCGKKVALLFAAIDLLLRAALSFRGAGQRQPQYGQKTAALRDFSPVDVRFGSEPAEAMRAEMALISAFPPKPEMS